MIIEPRSACIRVAAERQIHSQQHRPTELQKIAQFA
jgi:hypothetical protein